MNRPRAKRPGAKRRWGETSRVQAEFGAKRHEFNQDDGEEGREGKKY